VSDIEQLRGAIAAVVSEDLDQDHGYLTGFVVVCEWSGADGTRWLTATARDASDEEPPVWTVKGWLCQALDQADEDEGED
jgi:hypothetical protein